MAVVIRRVRVARAVSRRIGATQSVAIVIVIARYMVIAGARIPGAIVQMGAIAAVVARIVRTVIAAFLIGRARSPVAGTGIGRTLVDVVILLHRIGEPLMTPATGGVTAGIAVGL